MVSGRWVCTINAMSSRNVNLDGYYFRIPLAIIDMKLHDQGR